MFEQHKSNRVVFPSGQQKRLLEEFSAHFSIKKIAELCACSPRTIRDWKREKFSMDFTSLQKLCEATNTPFPTNIKILDRWWYTKYGGSAGGIAVMKKYGRVGGDSENRKKKWYEWWKRDGQFKQHPIINVTLPIKKPAPSLALAEFVGITLGDGGISQYQVTITLNREDDKEYIEFVTTLIKNLFGITPGIYRKKSAKADDIVVSRKELIKFCTTELGLKIGNKVKQQVDIPKWIKNNGNFRIACVRGLVDTDGSVFTHKYRVGKRWYAYKKLAFSSRSEPLLKSVYKIMQGVDLNPRLTKIDVRLDSVSDMQKYFKIVGTSNPKHWKRYQN